MKEISENRFLFEHLKEYRDLKRQIELDGLPSDPTDVRARFCAMVANAEGLRVLFGGTVDRSSIDECRELARIIRSHAARAMGATHTGTQTRQ